jgi:hypothetical protein
VFAILSVLIIVGVALLITRVATLALVATGLPSEVAKFQARSALTGVGFTTVESESMVSHPVRRRIVMTLMLVGNAGIVALVGSLILSFAGSSTSNDALIRLGLIIVGLMAIFALSRIRPLERRLTVLVGKVLARWTDIDVRDYVHLLQLTREYAVTELQVRPGDWLAGRSLTDLDLPQEGILILGIQRADGRFLGAPRGGAVIHPYDTLVMYGRSAVLAELDERPDDPLGDRAHEEAVAQHRQVTAEPDES